MTMPTTEKKPVTTANRGNGIVSPPSGPGSRRRRPGRAAAKVVAAIAASVATKPLPASPRSRRMAGRDRPVQLGPPEVGRDVGVDAAVEEPAHDLGPAVPADVDERLPDNLLRIVGWRPRCVRRP